MNIVILLLARHANTKAESIVIIVFMLAFFSVFIMKTGFSPVFFVNHRNKAQLT